ncbi:hypothetical protein [Isoptericola sp. NPDC055881]
MPASFSLVMANLPLRDGSSLGRQVADVADTGVRVFIEPSRPSTRPSRAS